MKVQSEVREDGARLVIRREFRATPEAVFDAWCDPRLLAKWMGPADGWTNPAIEVDLTVGGRFAITMREPGGADHRVGGEYLEIDRPSRLVFTWAWAASPDRVSRVMVEIAAIPKGRSEMILTHDRISDSAVRDQHEKGWNGCLDRLERTFL